jgi:glycosyltransferase involved in cell wall biosynthesis
MAGSDEDICLSIVICTYNGADDIRECLISLTEQDFNREYEIIVVDDGSVDTTVRQAKMVEDERIRIISKPKNEGLSAARNTGWKQAEGEVVAYIDDDAVAPSNWARQIYDRYKEGVDGVGGYPETYYNNIYGEYEVGRTRFIYGPNAENVEGAGGMNMSFRREVLSEVGGFDERFTHIGDDGDINRRLLKEGKNLVVDPSITVQHKFPTTFTNFCRAKFHRGLGEALERMKYGNNSLLRVAIKSILSIGSLPVAVSEGHGINKNSNSGNLLVFTILSYIHIVFYRIGVFYYLLAESYDG